MTARQILASMVAAALLLGGICAAMAQEQDGQKQAQALQAAVDAMQKVLQPGPSAVTLPNQASLHVPPGANFVRQPEAGAWATVSGYGRDDSLVGIVVPTAEENWITFIDYHPNVRIVEDEAKAWDADTLLANLKASTEQGNADRQKREEPQLEVKGWLQTPAYDAAGHKLIWAAISPEKGGDEDEGSGNVHAYALGRDGYFELTMVSPAGEIASHVAVVKAVLDGIHFGIGQRYEDYAASRDIKEQAITDLISSGAPGSGAQMLDTLKVYWIWAVAGLLVFAALVGGLVRVVRR
jgi:uncharacterized membrane-anchored protein